MSISNSLRILIIEDDYLIADDMARMLDGEGMSVVGPAATEADAALLLDDCPVDCAVLDVNLGGSLSFAIPHLLSDRGIPFIFVTGYDSASIPAEFQEVPLLQKPFVPALLLGSLAALTDREASHRKGAATG